MEWLWTIQLAINFVGVAALFVWWKERAAPRKAASAQPWLEEMALRAREWEGQAELLRKRADAQLLHLSRLCSQAQAILSGQSGHGPSLEEQELKALRDSPVQSSASASIPSVEDLEAAKASNRPSIPVDLKTLLRDQLN